MLHCFEDAPLHSELNEELVTQSEKEQIYLRAGECTTHCATAAISPSSPIHDFPR